MGIEGNIFHKRTKNYFQIVTISCLTCPEVIKISKIMLAFIKALTLHKFKHRGKSS